jgi:hypothetical protein
MDRQQDESIDAIEADNARWDALLATDESQAVLERLADEAFAELRAGKTRPMVFTRTISKSTLALNEDD